MYRLYVKKRRYGKGFRYNLELWKNNQYLKSISLPDKNFEISHVAELCRGLDAPSSVELYSQYYLHSKCIICGTPLITKCYSKRLKICCKSCYINYQRSRKRKNQRKHELKESRRTFELKHNFNKPLPSEFNQVDNPKKLGVHYKSFCKPVDKDDPDWDLELNMIDRELKRVKIERRYQND